MLGDYGLECSDGKAALR